MTSDLRELASDVAAIISKRTSGKDVTQLLQIVFLTVDEAAELLRVKPSTISTWISRDAIPVRYAGGRPIFLLAELLDWTLPENDSHSEHRLSTLAASRIARGKLTIAGRSNDGL